MKFNTNMTENKVRALQVRMLESEYQTLRETAAKSGMSISAWIREIIHLSAPGPEFKLGKFQNNPTMEGPTEPPKVLTITKSKICSTCGHETEHWAYDANGKAVCNECVLKAYPMVKA